MKYRKIIIIISLSKILSNTLRTDAYMHAHTRAHEHPPTPVAVRSVDASNHDSVMVGCPLFDAGRCFIEINNARATLYSRYFWGFFAYKKMLSRTETHTRDRMYYQTIRTVRYISRDDRARIATCSLRTPTDLRRIIV